jgi:hypothetical protein
VGEARPGSFTSTFSREVTLVSEYFHLGKGQGQLDFVDVPVDGDIPLFIDPFAISLRPDKWSQEAAGRIQSFFEGVIDRIRSGDESGGRSMLGYLTEPNETRLGFSVGRPRGAGIGSGQASDLYDALAGSAAVQSGFITSLEESELLIPGVGRDKVSDLTTNVLRASLAQYTLEQCRLHGIDVSARPLPPYFDADRQRWLSAYFDLPVADGRPLLLVPKAIVRYDLAYDHQKYYRMFVLEYLRSEELEGGTSLVKALRSGERVVYKKDVATKYPNSKQFLYQFSRDHPEILEKYRVQLMALERTVDSPVEDPDERQAAELLIGALNGIPSGSETAGAYHSLMVGLLEFLFFPQLMNPRKEHEIHDGRKRIDIMMENGARAGRSLHALHDVKGVKCAYVPIECKNYSREIANPELDQLAGRFSRERGEFGILVCRQFDDFAGFIRRCRDTLRDGRGLILPLDDQAIREMLSFVASGRRDLVDAHLGERISDVIAA